MPAAGTAGDASSLGATGGRAEGGQQAGSTRPGPGGPGNGPRGEPRSPSWGWGKRLALAGHVLVAVRPDDQTLRLFDVRTGSLLQDIIRDGRRLQGILASPESGRLLTIEVGPFPAPAPARAGAMPRAPEFSSWNGEIAVNLWDVSRPNEPIKTLAHLKTEGQRPTFAMGAFSPDGKTVAIAFSRGTSVSLFSAIDGEPDQSIDTQAEQINSLALGANKMMAAATGNTIQLWDLESKTFLTSLTATRGAPRLMRFNPQGNLLATAAGSSVELWDAVSHKLLAVLPGVDFFTDLAFTPDGRTLAAGGGRRATATSVWKVSDSAARVQLSSSDIRPSSLAFAEDGSLAIGCAGGEVEVLPRGWESLHVIPVDPGRTGRADGPESRPRSRPRSHPSHPDV